MKLQSFKRIVTEDVKEEFRELVSKLAYSINPFAEEVIEALNKNLTSEDNLNETKKEVTVTVNSSGTPTTPLQFKTDLSRTSFGIDVVKAENITNSTTYPTGHPFLSYSEVNGVITVNNITGLPANNKFKLKLIIKG